jgi:hypothetical protein
MIVTSDLGRASLQATAYLGIPGKEPCELKRARPANLDAQS